MSSLPHSVSFHTKLSLLFSASFHTKLSLLFSASFHTKLSLLHSACFHSKLFLLHSVSFYICLFLSINEHDSNTMVVVCVEDVFGFCFPHHHYILLVVSVGDDVLPVHRRKPRHPQFLLESLQREGLLVQSPRSLWWVWSPVCFV